MNKVILLGNLTKDPESRITQSNKSVTMTTFTLAVNRKYAKEGGTQADFFNCVAFGKQADFIQEYFYKGARMMIAGRLQNNNYTNNKGEKVYSVQLIVEEVEFAEKKHTANDVPQNDTDEFMEIPEDLDPGLPFN